MKLMRSKGSVGAKHIQNKMTRRSNQSSHPIWRFTQGGYQADKNGVLQRVKRLVVASWLFKDFVFEKNTDFLPTKWLRQWELPRV